ncbi:uncharacterized protein A4U43_C02F7120 [Asparagus officinalis]|uniref:RNase H type-1 domain-containing protein n=1 Tax=Asparagus officinalis TaxID=4686 RepID=A0A5P1FHB6_ASPOF|nr:uncharacterized protein A4U43_C02F7120 [Asparagus officinalis]
MVTWEPPMDNWIKINFDGACKLDSSQAGTGFLIRCAGSPILAAAAIPIDHIEVNYAELIGAWSALTWCYKRYGACLVWIEGDSKHVLDLLSKEPYHTDSQFWSTATTSFLRWKNTRSPTYSEKVML